MSESFEAELGKTIEGLAARLNSELYALSEDELREQWFFKFDDEKTVRRNLYEFTDMLDLHRRRCRKWEEHHNGSSCVVERVRDKYLMPRIDEFLAEFKKHI